LITASAAIDRAAIRRGLGTTLTVQQAPVSAKIGGNNNHHRTAAQKVREQARRRMTFLQGPEELLRP
jgi:hypothetical protein